MTRDPRQELCRQVLERLSDIVEGEAPEDFCAEVDRVLGSCPPYLAFRATFEETIRLTRELGEPEGLLDEDGFRGCVERARERLGDGLD